MYAFWRSVHLPSDESFAWAEILTREAQIFVVFCSSHVVQLYKVWVPPALPEFMSCLSVEPSWGFCGVKIPLLFRCQVLAFRCLKPTHSVLCSRTRRSLCSDLGASGKKSRENWRLLNGMTEFLCMCERGMLYSRCIYGQHRSPIPTVAAEASSLSDGYGGRRQGRGRRSLDDYDESEPEELTRVFVALFDYDPMSMSPNPDAADEELPFKEGQIIKVVESFLMCRVHIPFRMKSRALGMI